MGPSSNTLGELMIRHGWLLVGLAILLGSLTLLAQDAPPPAKLHVDEVDALMQAKLASTQRIVEGLLSHDFDRIERGGEQLRKICDSASWIERSSDVYLTHRRQQRLLAEQMVELARAKNLEGAAWCYQNTLANCIGCHSHCRDVLRITRRGAPTAVTPIPTSEPDRAE